MNRLIKQFLGIAWLVWCAPVAAQWAPRIVQAAAGSSTLALLETARGFELEDWTGARRLLERRPGAEFTAVAELDGGWVVAGQRLVADGGELVLLLSEGDQTRTLGEPDERFGFRQRPVPLVENGRLAGLAWLEGDGGENNAVLASRRGPEGWEPAATVAPFAGGAQLALGGAVLEDGSWLLVWSAVDTAQQDDEIMWSRSDGVSWSAPVSLHASNGVPDILPAVAAVGRGALVAWSRFDGKDYRLRIARLDGNRWLDTGFAGEEGSLLASFVPASTAVGLLYSTVTPSTWTVLALDEDGLPVNRAAMVRASAIRPRVVAADASEVTLRFDPAPAAGRPAGDPPEALVSEPPPPIDHRLEWVPVP